jgi:hypothetical protein
MRGFQGISKNLKGASDWFLQAQLDTVFRYARKSFLLALYSFFIFQADEAEAQRDIPISKWA